MHYYLYILGIKEVSQQGNLYVYLIQGNELAERVLCACTLCRESIVMFIDDM